MELICTPTSAYARRVLVLAHEIGIIDLITITVVRPRDSSDLLWRCNPIGKVPTLCLPDGSSLYDSQVICDYLISTYRPNWGLDVTSTIWTHRTRLSLLNQTSDAGSQAKKLLSQDPPQKKAAEFQTDKIDRSLQYIGTSWDSFEDELSLATIGLACTFDWLLDRFPAMPWKARHPRIAKWFTSFKERSSMKATEIS